jgi:hypothetical protein
MQQLRLNINEKTKMYLLFMDIKSAYERVNHKIMKQLLQDDVLKDYHV